MPAVEPPSRRVRVTSPRTGARTSRPTAGTAEIDAQTGLGEVYMRSLVRTQLRLSLTALAGVLGPLAALPMLFVLAPDVGASTLGDVPAAWVLLGVFVHPVLVAVGWWYSRRAEQVEAAFAELVERP